MRSADKFGYEVGGWRRVKAESGAPPGRTVDTHIRRAIRRDPQRAIDAWMHHHYYATHSWEANQRREGFRAILAGRGIVL